MDQHLRAIIPMRILVVEDEVRLNNIIKGFIEDGFCS